MFAFSHHELRRFIPPRAKTYAQYSLEHAPFKRCRDKAFFCFTHFSARDYRAGCVRKSSVLTPYALQNVGKPERSVRQIGRIRR
jgi:hypothetical protein